MIWVRFRCAISAPLTLIPERLQPWTSGNLRGQQTRRSCVEMRWFAKTKMPCTTNGLSSNILSSSNATACFLELVHRVHLKDAVLHIIHRPHSQCSDIVEPAPRERPRRRGATGTRRTVYHAPSLISAPCSSLLMCWTTPARNAKFRTCVATHSWFFLASPVNTHGPRGDRSGARGTEASQGQKMAHMGTAKALMAHPACGTSNEPTWKQKAYMARRPTQGDKSRCCMRNPAWRPTKSSR